MGIDVKTWMKNRPSVEAVRPGSCPRCGVDNQPLGDRLNLHDHGVRLRTLWGPMAPEDAPNEHSDQTLDGSSNSRDHLTMHTLFGRRRRRLINGLPRFQNAIATSDR